MRQQQPLLADRAFYLGPMFRQAAARHGGVFVTLDRPLDVAPHVGVSLTYSVLAQLVEELSGRLWEAGIRPSEHVVVHKTDNVDIVLLTCALSRIGAVPLEKYAGAEPPAPIRLHPREPSLITHSSGTTGIPKLAVHCPNTMWNRLVPQKAMGLPTRGETAALHMSFVHSRFYHRLGVLLHYGSPLVLITDPDPTKVAPLLVRHRPGIVETHPNTFVLWEELTDAPGAPLSRVRSYGSTFDAIHPRTVQRLLDASKRRLPWLIQLYGQSETGPVAFQLFTRRTAARADGRRVGIGIPGFTRVRVTDDSGRRTRPGTPGRIEARTRGRILTCLGAREQYLRQLDGGWWQMGDMGYQSRLGALYLIDREIDQIDSTADLPPMADPRQWRFEELPMTATRKVKRVEITRMLAESSRA
ncbi:AMP-binding protein [Streptomyces sp. NPDC001634]|uniref:AMP-binding protein n=1 Tax=Streptomyces sp. NPDC001634 TaxID=3154390 RepID=UPI003329FBA9